MNRDELKEWVGVKPADYLVYGAIAAMVAMFFSFNTTLNITLSVLAVVACLGACFLGMRPDPKLSRLTNLVKLVSYPAVLVCVGVFIYLIFFVWTGEYA